MTSSAEQLRTFLLSWFELHLPGSPFLWYDIAVVAWLTIIAIVLHLLFKAIAKKVFSANFNFGKNGQASSTVVPLVFKLIRRISYVLQAVIIIIQANVWLKEGVTFQHIVQVVADQWIILFSLLSLFTLLDIFQALSDRKARQAHFPLRGLLQTVKLIASVLTGILAISLLMDKSPLILLSGLGALSAILLLVFKDPILGLVAGIQLSANNMLAVGDWLEMPKYGADGDVIDIALTTVKVRNWDKTTTTIPTYALISDSFKNWRGMSEAGGRRIKRAINIQMSTVSFLTNEHADKLKKADLLQEYLSTSLPAIEEENKAKRTDLTMTLNGRRLTNLGTFRRYLLTMLKSHPYIHQNMTLLVRQLSPSNEGIPIEIYAFTNTTKWDKYEDIQSDIFDHILAVLPEFGLKAHESPTGDDVRYLKAIK
ncbi:mechanosensitive ion channel family protein [Aliiglaciecola lipolytica]|uniref:Mechanosensing system component YbdG n=1 Tax=Aliiglaciecola lipolytica E3 TaxID=1127673 RepID=K6YRT7_9ALTE|nr:mechanosensitive ion channel domain-containing protein [Aliiglaciecola lipolytica]GAC14030.1 small-conductance mechanosensitive channel [Aliiglaciecola lipolytica E3]